MSDTQPTGDGRQRMSRGKVRLLWAFAIVILIPSGFGFVRKMIHFYSTLRGDEDGGAITLVPMANYLTIALGFIFLLAWAVAHGMFKDIERPKYTMLDTEAKLDRGENL